MLQAEAEKECNQHRQIIHSFVMLAVYFNYKLILFMKQLENVCFRCPPAFEE